MLLCTRICMALSDELGEKGIVFIVRFINQTVFSGVSLGLTRSNIFRHWTKISPAPFLNHKLVILRFGVGGVFYSKYQDES